MTAQDGWMAASIAAYVAVLVVAWKLEQVSARYAWWFTFGVGAVSLVNCLWREWWATSFVIAAVVSLQIWRWPSFSEKKVE